MYIKQWKYCSALIIDISKDFDMVNHNNLLVKLESLGLRSFMYEFLRSFRVNDYTYSVLNISLGVP